MTATLTEAPKINAGLEDFRAGKPGIYENIPAEEYHRLRAISSTALKRVYCQTPKHAKAVLDNPDLIGSDEIDIGGAAHAILLTPDEFEDTYTCAGKCEATVKTGDKAGQPCGNDGRILRGDSWFCGVHGKGYDQEARGTVLTRDAYRRVRGIHDAVWANDTARDLLQQATEREITVLWVEEGPDGERLLCKARYDVLCRHIGVLPDLKTCRSVKPDWFCDQAWKLGYHLQLAHYLRGGIVAGIAADLPTIIAVENEEPFDCVVFLPTHKLMERGVQARTLAMATLLECERSGDWPGHSARSGNLLDVPSWVK
jgi:hypothetical protein